MELEKYSIGIGDRFGREGEAQLGALVAAAAQGTTVTPVWNKSFREHELVGSSPDEVRLEADAAVRSLGWGAGYCVDADHIGLGTVDRFLEASDFFTLDVADFIGRPSACRADQAEDFARRFEGRRPEKDFQLLPEHPETNAETLREIARNYLPAVREAGRIYRHIAERKGEGNFVTEVSMDETDRAQSPVELFFILGALADEGVPVRTIAPRFSGRFNKGVDYAGDVDLFAREFEADVVAVRCAVEAFGLPSGLKLSVHSGSDKFSIYAPIRASVRRHDAGLHLKTAGTTWLEELIGLASAGGDATRLVADMYRQAFVRREELCRPYAPVIDVDAARLPDPAELADWSGEELANALRHDPACASYNPHLRQLMHVAYRVAAESGARFRDALERYRDTIAHNVTFNILERHVRPLFLDAG